jgi:hypothetical protein
MAPVMPQVSGVNGAMDERVVTGQRLLHEQDYLANVWVISQ